MALYDGFFDAVLNEDTYQYDREYDSGSFTEYFGEIVGSGVCVHENENSMKVGLNGTSAFIAPGYLFIQGHWLKNTAEYAVPISGTGVHAVFAKLNMGARRIEVGSQPKADPEEYPNTLVLAYVTVDIGGAVSVEDTRYRTDICGVINSAGALASKVEWAIHYINNEIELKLKQVEADIKAQEAVLDAKIEEVNTMMEKLAPPPIGTVKFSASSEIEEGWLRCDGSFVSETDYPELVAALGKVTPAEEQFVERLGLRDAALNISNVVMHDKKAWMYVQESGTDTGTLYGVDSADVVEVSVSNVGGLTASTSLGTVLSICGGWLYLAQAPSSASSYVLLQTEFTGDVDSVNMEDVSADIQTILTGNSLTLLEMVYPQVSHVNGLFYLALGYLDGEKFNDSTNATGYALYFVSWPSGNIGSASTFSRSISVDKSTASPAAYVWTKLGQYGWRGVLGFSDKNDMELVLPTVNGALISGSLALNQHIVKFSVGSIPIGVIGDPTGNNNAANAYDFSTNNGAAEQQADLYYQRFETNYALRPKICRPVIGGGVCLWSAYITGTGQVEVTWIPYEGDNLIEWTVTVPMPPSRARIFPDSFCYASMQNVWFIFLGTGLLFSLNPGSDNWGYLDTTDVLGIITHKGSIHYDPDSNSIYMGGIDSTGVPRLGRLQMDTIFDFSNDGAWLPMIASDGVPAYIKAKEAT